MKHFLMTTALAAVLATPALAQSAGDMAAAPGDILAGELIGKSVYVDRVENTSAETPSGTMPQKTDAMHDIDSMDNIGEITEIVLSDDGRTKAIVIEVGGFLGVGEREVALGFDQIHLTPEMDDPSDYYVVAEASLEEIENGPAFDRTAIEERRADAGAPADGQAANGAGNPTTVADWRDSRDPLVAPAVERDTYSLVQASEMSADQLIGASVYDVNDETIGDVNDVILLENGDIDHFVVDIGGFLGIGTHTVALGNNEVTVLREGADGDLRLYVDVTKEQLQAMPAYIKAS